MAAPKKKFAIPTVEEMQLADAKEVQRPFRRLFKQREAVCEKGDQPVQTCSGPSQEVSLPVTDSALTACFSRFRGTEKHVKIVNELKTIEPFEVKAEPTKDIPQAPPCSSSGSNALIVNYKQKGNPLLKFLCNVRLEYSDIIPDYIMGKTMCALFLSLRYHLLFPNYIHDRLKLLGKQYLLRVLLVQVDTSDPHHALKELTKIAILADCTLLLCWSADEAARYLETYKIFENKPPDILMKKQEADSHSKVIDALASIKSVNRSDAASLLSTFGTLENIIKASKEDFEVCPGMGPTKIKNLYSTLHDPFLKTTKQ